MRTITILGAVEKGLLEEAILQLEDKDMSITYMDNVVRFLASLNDIQLLFVYRETFDEVKWNLIKETLKHQPRLKTVFVCNSYEHVKDAFYVHSYDYLVNPKAKEIVDLLNDYCTSLKASEKLYVKANAVRYLIDLKDIHYMECVKKTRHVQIVGTSKLETTMYLHDLFEKVKYSGFFMPHRSFVVNIKYVKEVRKRDVILVDDTRIPISQLKIREIKKYIDKEMQ